MHKRYAAKSTLFLMELVIVLFFFSICAAVCVSLFGYSQQMARESDALSNGVLAARRRPPGADSRSFPEW